MAADADTPSVASPLGSAAANQWCVSAAHCDLVRAAQPPRPITLPALPQSITLDLARTAVIVIDMQNDFCHPQGWLASIGVDVRPAQAPVQPLTRLLPALRRHAVPVVWVNWGNRPDRLNLSPALLHVYNGDGQSVGLGDDLPSAPAAARAVLQKDAWGAALFEPLKAEPSDIWVDKFRMSGFWDTPLDSILRNLRIDSLLFAGVNADQCVLATLMDANFAGYDTVLLQDCSATTSPDYCWQATMYNVRQCFGFTASGADVLQALA
jgi:nicotinamidase-related amidase